MSLTRRGVLLTGVGALIGGCTARQSSTTAPSAGPSPSDQLLRTHRLVQLARRPGPAGSHRLDARCRRARPGLQARRRATHRARRQRSRLRAAGDRRAVRRTPHRRGQRARRHPGLATPRHQGHPRRPHVRRPAEPGGHVLARDGRPPVVPRAGRTPALPRGPSGAPLRSHRPATRGATRRRVGAGARLGAARAADGGPHPSAVGERHPLRAPALRLRHRPAQRPPAGSGLRHLGDRRSCGRRPAHARAAWSRTTCTRSPPPAPTTSAAPTCSGAAPQWFSDDTHHDHVHAGFAA